MLRLALIAALLASPAHAFTARNGMTVGAAGPDIGVAFGSGHSDTDYWCAAGDYAQRVLGAPVSTRMWRASPKPRGSGEGIRFTLDEARQVPGAGLSQFGAGAQDGAMSVGAAVAGLCRPLPPLWAD